MKIFAKLPYREQVKELNVTNDKCITMRRAIKLNFKEFKQVKLKDISFDEFEIIGKLPAEFFNNHGSPDNAFIVKVKYMFSSPAEYIEFFTPGSYLAQITTLLNVNLKIYVRNCYKEIWQSFKDYELERHKDQIYHPQMIARAFLTGTPGIGLTSFLPFLIDTMLKEKRQVMFGSRDLKGFIYWTSKDTYKHIKEDDIEPYLTDRDIFFLLDSRDLYNTLGPCIICSSPRSDIASQFRKTALKLFMPVWEWHEIQSLHQEVYFDKFTVRQLYARFHLIGGVPRYLFENLQEMAATILHDALKASDNSHLQRLFEFKGKNGEEPSHRLIHLNSSIDTAPPWGQYSLSYASDFVSTMVASKYQKLRNDMVVQWLDETSDIGKSGGLRGNLFETLGHLQLKKGNFACKSLESDGVQQTIDIPCKSIEIMGQQDISQSVWVPNIYYKPLFKFCECIDSWTIIDGELWAFQFKVSCDHDISNALYWCFLNWNLKHHVTVVYDENKFKKYSKMDIKLSEKSPYDKITKAPQGYGVQQHVLLLDCGGKFSIDDYWEIQKKELEHALGMFADSDGDNVQQEIDAFNSVIST
eukprot:NODE_233_length_12044_cov_0.738803.p1 type:complete len:583 gc:universal NODE_233_length_12044_cov_0.738803:5804-7552(+)